MWYKSRSFRRLWKIKKIRRRYADDFIIGVRGSQELAKKIKMLVNSFLKSNLHLQLNLEKTKITNTYSNKVRFLGMMIYNKYARDLPYRNSREIENLKRVKNKNQIIKSAKTKKILKNTRESFVKLLDRELKNVYKGQKSDIHDIFKPLYNESYRSKLRNVANLLNSEETESSIINKEDSTVILDKVIPKKVPINNIEIMVRVHRALLNYNAVIVDRAHGKRVWPKKIKEFLVNHELTYCPENIELPELQIKALILKDRVKHKVT